MWFSFDAHAWSGLTSMAFLLKLAGLAAFAIGIPCWRYFTQQRSVREDQEVRGHSMCCGWGSAYADPRLSVHQPRPLMAPP